MVKKYKKSEAAEVVEKGAVEADKLMDEMEGKQIGDTLPEELAAITFVLFMGIIDSEPLLKMYEEDIRNLATTCAYVGMRYEQQRK